MKYLAALLLALTLAAPVHAQLTVPQGGTGWTNIVSGTLLTGNGSNLRLSTTTPTYPLTLSGGALSLAFGTTTANTWSQLQTFSSGISINAETVTDLSGLGLAVSGNALGILSTGADDEECLTYEATGPTVEWQSCGSGVTELGTGFSTTTASSLRLATSSDTNIGLNIVASASGLTFTPTWTGTLADARVSDTLTIGAGSTVADGALSGNVSLLGQTIGVTELASEDFGSFTCNGTACTIDNAAVSNAMLANSTISGIALGNNLANLTATDSTLTFSGAYNGGTARTIGINLANANTWTGATTFTATTTHATSTFARIGIGTTTPQWPLQVSSASGPQLTLSDGALTTAPFNFRANGNYLTISTSSPATFATTTSSIAQFDSSTGSTTVLKLDKVGTATSTFAGGINVTSGCYAVNGTCVGGSASSDTSVFAYQTSGSNLTTSWNGISFQTEDFDTSTMHDNSTNNSRITIQTSGKYHVGGCAAVASNTILGARIRLNGTTVLARQMQGNSNNGEGACVSTIYNFTATDYIELQGAASSVNTTGDRLTNFWAFKID